MKIIYSDNIPDDTSSEYLWLENVNLTMEVGQCICDKLNKGLGDHQGMYYRVVPDNHKLYKWEP